LNKGSTENGHTGESGCIGSRVSEIYHAIKWNSRCKLSLCWRHFVLLATLLGLLLPASRSRHIQHRTKRSTCVSSFLKQRSLRCPLTVVSRIRVSLSRKIIIEIRSALHMSLYLYWRKEK